MTQKNRFITWPLPKTFSENSVDLVNSRGERLAAVFHRGKSKKVIVMAHGFTGHKTETGRLLLTTARYLAQAGFNVLRFDYFGSGDSQGEFYEFTPSMALDDLLSALDAVSAVGFKEVGLLGISMGGALAICASAKWKNPALKALVTWSSVPGFEWWLNEWKKDLQTTSSNPIHIVGKKFFKDIPRLDVPQSYLSLDIPKLQIQGTNDIPKFREVFSEYFPQAKSPKKHIVIPEADHTFNQWPHREKAIKTSVAWFKKYV